MLEVVRVLPKVDIFQNIWRMMFQHTHQFTNHFVTNFISAPVSEGKERHDGELSKEKSKTAKLASFNTYLKLNLSVV